MSVQVQKILDTFPELVQWLDGDRATECLAPCSQVQPTPKGLVYIADTEHLENVLNSEVATVVVLQKISARAKELNQGRKALLVTANTYLAMALINERYFSLPFKRQPIASLNGRTASTQVSPTAQIGENVTLGPGVVICDHVEIGADTFIGAYTIIEPNTKIGKNCMIHPHVYIGHTCTVGNDVEIKPFSTIGSDGFGYAHDHKGNHYRIPHYGPVIIEDCVHIGANVNIDRGTFDPAKIGYGTKIDNHCHLGHNIQVGRNCLITAGIIVAGSTKIGDNCVFAGRASVNGHIEITSGCTFGPISGITKSVLKPGVYSGYPVEPFRDFLKSRSTIPHLPRMRKNLARVMKHLGLKEDEDSSSTGAEG